MSIRYILTPMIIAFLVCSCAATGKTPDAPVVPGTTPLSEDLLLPVVQGNEPGPWGGSSSFTPGTEIFLLPVQPGALNEQGLYILIPQDSEPIQPFIPDPAILCPSGTGPWTPGPYPEQPVERMVSGTGTIRWVDLEGGFFGIEGDDGALYLPQNLGGRYRVDGIQVAFSGFLDPGAATIQMWGTPISLLSITGLDEIPMGVMVTYRRSGGIAGFQDELVVYTDGTAVITRKGRSATITLSSSDLDALVRAGGEAGFPALFTEYLPVEGACDLFFYEVTWDGITVYTADTAVPASLVPLLDLLNQIVANIPPR